MASELTRLRDQLLDGRGFEVIRGLPVADIGDEHAQAAMVVLSAHVGGFRPQNSAGDLVGHVRNTGAAANDPNVRLYQTNERQTFHTDSTDVVCLLALSTAVEGGESLVVNARTTIRPCTTEPVSSMIPVDPATSFARGSRLRETGHCTRCSHNGSVRSLQATGVESQRRTFRS